MPTTSAHYYKNIFHWKSSSMRLIFSLLLITSFFASGAIPSHYVHTESVVLRLFLMLLPFVCAMSALWLVMKFVHQTDFSDLIHARESSGVSLRKIFFGFMLWLCIQLVLESVMYMYAPSAYEFHNVISGKWLALLLVAFVMIPVQSGFEELLVRSYLLQYFYKLLKNPLLALIITSVLFALLHARNPEIAGYGTGIMLLYYFLAATGMGLISYFDGRAELAIGMHTANNLYAALLVSYKNAAFDTNPPVVVVEMNVFMSVALFVIGMLVFLLICSKKYHWRLPEINFTKE